MSTLTVPASTDKNATYEMLRAAAERAGLDLLAQAGGSFWLSRLGRGVVLADLAAVETFLRGVTA